MNYGQRTPKRKKIVYLYLNNKDRIVTPPGVPVNVCRWINLPPLPPGKGVFSLVSGYYKSPVNRFARFMLYLQKGGAYQYETTDNGRITLGYLENTTNQVLTITHPPNREIKVISDAKDFKNVDITVDFETERANVPGLGQNDKLSFILKFEYD
jgi:hypothetical protein